MLELPIAFGFLGELGLDFAHLGEAERRARAGRVDAVLGRQRHRDKECGDYERCNDSRPCKLSRRRQIISGRCLGVKHVLSLSYARLGNKVAGELITDQHEAGGHHQHVGGIGMLEKARCLSPITHRDENHRERNQLADLDTDIEGEKVGDESVLRDLVLQNLRRQAEAVEEAEDQCRELGIGLLAEPALEGPEIVERLVDDGEADDRINQVGTDVPAEIDAEQHRRRMADGEEAHIDCDVLQPVEEEDHAEEKQQVIISGHHMLRAEIDEGDQMDARDVLDDYGWLKPGEMLDGLGMAETTPGPLIMVVQFVGFMGAYRDPGWLVWAVGANALI